MATEEQTDRIFGTVGELRRELKSEAIAQAITDSVPSTMAKYLTPERVQRIIVGAASREPKLLKCTRASLVAAVVTSLQLGLEPGGPLGHAYLVPFMNRKVNPNRLEVVLIIGYQGYIALARRSGEIEDIHAQVVYSRDAYDIEAGDNPRIFHKPFIPDPLLAEPLEPLGPGDIGRGVPVLAYCIARFKEGGGHKEWMTVSDIEHIRSQYSRAESGPWFDHWEMQARKTVIRRARHYWPLSAELASAFEADDRGSVSLEEAMGEARAAAAVEMSKTERVKAELAGAGVKTLTPEAVARGQANADKLRADEAETPDGTKHDPDTGEVAAKEPTEAELAEADSAAEAEAQKTMSGAGF